MELENKGPRLLYPGGAVSRFPAKPAGIARNPHLSTNSGATEASENVMSLTVRKMPAAFAAEILGADLRQEPSRALVDTVNAAVAEHAVVVLRDQAITDEHQVRFSRAFGPLELPPSINLRGSIRRRRLGPELYDVSNIDENGDFLPAESLQLASNRANEEFHTDSSFN